jgi:hypothetical protein
VEGLYRVEEVRLRENGPSEIRNVGKGLHNTSILAKKLRCMAWIKSSGKR